MKDCGLFVDLEESYLGASPDAVVSCKCCGQGILEVKCPYTVRDGITDDENFFMSKANGKWYLKNNHIYYYQVQMQLHVCMVSYCDFVVWTMRDLLIQRVRIDEIFFASKVEHLQAFYTNGILPEVIGKWYSRRPVANEDGVVSHPLT